LQYTRPPWQLIQRSYANWNSNYWVVCANGDLKKKVVSIDCGRGSHVTKEEDFANARLISAAPELFEAAKKAVVILNHYAEKDFEKKIAFKLASAVIKAMHEEPDHIVP